MGHTTGTATSSSGSTTGKPSATGTTPKTWTKTNTDAVKATTKKTTAARAAAATERAAAKLTAVPRDAKVDKTAASAKVVAVEAGATAAGPISWSNEATSTNIDADGFQTVQHRHRTGSTASTSSNQSNQSTSKIIRSYFIAGLPREVATTKAIASLCNKINLKASSVTVYSNGTASISSYESDIRKKLETLGHQIGEPISVTSRRPATRRNPDHQQKPLSFSCVARGVEMDVTSEDVMDALANQGITVTRAWRIRSKATDQETRLIRILTPSQTSLDSLLTKGLQMFNHIYKVEPSNPPKPQPIQCGRCLKFNHSTSDCPDMKSVCGTCGGDHNSIHCKPNAPLKCNNCGGDHHASAWKCTARPREASGPEAAAPLRTTDAPATQDQTSNPETQTQTIIRFTITTLLNLLPDRREQVLAVVSPLINQFFGLQAVASYAGNCVHITLAGNRTTPPTNPHPNGP